MRPFRLVLYKSRESGRERGKAANEFGREKVQAIRPAIVTEVPKNLDTEFSGVADHGQCTGEIVLSGCSLDPMPAEPFASDDQSLAFEALIILAAEHVVF